MHTYIHTYIPTYIHTCIHAYIHTYIYTYIHIYIYVLHVYFVTVAELRLMLAVTSGATTAGSLALAYKLLSWAEKSEPLSLPFAAASHWRFDALSFMFGAICGIALIFLAEVWFTVKWVILSWADRRAEQKPVALGRAGQKPLYKLC